MTEQDFKTMFVQIINQNLSESDSDKFVEVDRPEVILVAESIVSVRLNNDKFKLVLFKPTKMTLKKISAFQHDDQINLELSDRNGDFAPERRQVIRDYFYDENLKTAIVDLEVVR